MQSIFQDVPGLVLIFFLVISFILVAFIFERKTFVHQLLDQVDRDKLIGHIMKLQDEDKNFLLEELIIWKAKKERKE